MIYRKSKQRLMLTAIDSIAEEFGCYLTHDDKQYYIGRGMRMVPLNVREVMLRCALQSACDVRDYVKRLCETI